MWSVERGAWTLHSRLLAPLLPRPSPFLRPPLPCPCTRWQAWEARIAALRLQETAARAKYDAYVAAKAEARAKAKEAARRLRMATIEVTDTESEDHSDAESENSEAPPADKVCVALCCWRAWWGVCGVCVGCVWGGGSRHV